MDITVNDIIESKEPDFQFFTKELEVKASKDGRRIVRGYATTDDVDREYEVITKEAIEMSALDLINSPTVFYEHRHSDYPVGKVVDAIVTNGKMMIEVEISKTADRVWTLLQEGILRAFSIGGRFLETKDVLNEELGKELTHITKMELFEVSIVGLPANPNALITSVSKAITKSLDGKARGDGQGQGGDRQGDGGADICVCPECDAEIAHVKGTPCNETKCPECGTAMIGKNIKEDKKIINIDEIQTLVPSKGDEKKIQSLKQKGDFISTYLNEVEYKQKITEQVYSYFKLALISKAVKEFQEKDGWKLKDVLNINEYTGKRTRPVYSKLQTSREKTEELLVDGFYCLEKGTDKLVVEIAPYYGCFGVNVYSDDSSKDLADNFIEGYEVYASDNNFLKGEKITPQGKFLPIPETTFDDVKILEAKKQAIKVGALEFFKKKDIYVKNKLTFKRGLIFAGEPGTGKTLVGKALMKETDSTFIWLTAKDLLTHYGDIDAKAFGRLLEMAKELAPSVLFAEDIDDYLESKSAIDTIKTQMDGLDSMEGIVTILCTNYPERIPKSLIDRPSRFDDVIMFDLPTETLRYEILDTHLKSVKIKNRKSVLTATAKNSEGLTGAHLKEVVIYSILLASDEGRDYVTGKDFIRSLDKVKKTRELIQTIEEKKSCVLEIKNKAIPELSVKEENMSKKNKELDVEITQEVEETVEVEEITVVDKSTEEVQEEAIETTTEEVIEEEVVVEKSFEEKMLEAMQTIADGISEIKTLVTPDIKSTEVEEIVEEVIEEEEVVDDEKKVKTKRKGLVETKGDVELTEDEKLLEQIKGMSLTEIMETPEVWDVLDEDMQKSIKNEYFKNGLGKK